MRLTISKALCIFTALISLYALAELILPAYASPESADTAMTSEAFEILHRVGDAANAGGGGEEALRSGCNIAARLGEEQVDSVWELLNFEQQDRGSFDNLVSWLGSNARGRLSVNQVCSALQGGSGFDVSDTATTLQDAGINALMGEGLALARGSGLPYLSHLEIEGGFTGDSPQFSVLSVQPLWEDREHGHFIFNQVSWQHESGDTDDGDADDTLNAGFAYRKLLQDERLLLGANAFFDHQTDQNHNRLSLGVDAQTSLYGLAANRYIALSDWKGLDRLYEARALSGWDLELSGRLPEYPDVTGYLRGFTWDSYRDSQGSVDDIYGVDASVEWSPVPALVFAGGMTDENNEKPDIQAAMRLRLNFNEPLALQFVPRAGLESVSDKVWNKVRRENTIRTQVRKRLTTGLTVTETAGANSATTQEGTFSLAVGLILNMPATVTVANTVGAIARLRFADGAILTLGQDTEVIIEPERITLNRGVAQYVSGSDNRTVNVPGATIELLGTDIDVSTAAGTSNVRVRDGTIRITGAAAGSATITAGNMARSVNGVVATVAQGSPDYITYTDLISTLIDRVASASTGSKVAPYAIAAPRLIATTDTPGQPISIGLTFNAPVTAAGGPVRLNFTMNGNSRTAAISSGSGTADLQFSYILQVADVGATSLTITALDLNGGTLTGDNKPAVTTIADTTLNLSGSVGASPTLIMNLASNSYSLLGTAYNSLTSFLTAVGGTFTRASNGTYYDASGLIQTAANNVPRFDYDPVTHVAKGILIEEARTNLLTRSEELDNAAWGRADVSVTANVTTAPNGTMTADRVYANGTSNSYILSSSYSFSAGQTITRSIYAKADNSPRIIFEFSDGGLGTVTFNLSTLSVSANSGATGRMESVGNGWYRLIVTKTFTNSSASAGGRVIYIDQYGTGGANQGVFLWGAQAEIAAQPSSYIPTVASTVARQPDNLLIAKGAWFNPTQGTWLAGFDGGRESTQGFYGRVISHDTSLTVLSTDCADTVNVGTWAGGSSLCKNSGNDFYTTPGLAAMSYNQTTLVRSLTARGLTPNGGAYTGTYDSAGGVFGIGRSAAGPANMLNGHINLIRYYPTRLPDADLQSMTAP